MIAKRPVQLCLYINTGLDHSHASNQHSTHMDKHPSRLVDQLHAVHARQQKVVQQFQVDNARLLSDLMEIRRERDNFRAEAARFRREHADLQNRLEELLSDYHDLKREHANMVRSHATSVGGRPQRVGSTKVCSFMWR